MRDPSQTMESFMRYGKKYLPLRQFDSPEDAKRWILEMDRIATDITGSDRHISDFAAGLASDSRRTQQIIGGAIKIGAPATFTKLQSKVLGVEFGRGVKARRIDEAKTSKHLLKLRKENVGRWARNPAKFDLEGIDTKTHELIRGSIRDKTAKWVGRGLNVINDNDVHVFVVRKDRRDRLYAMSVINGQRVGKRVYSRFGTLRSLRK